ncbi:abortive infection family protein [Actinomycetes bacterium KLBMP 9759]
MSASYFMASLTGSLLLLRPDGLEDAAWAAIDDPLQRLNRALAENDQPLVVGTSKDLAEAVAKVVLAARGETVASNEDFPKLVTRAQVALERQPGQGLAADEAVRLTAQSALKAIKGLPELRNRFGSGHGRAFAPEVAEEVVLISVDLAMMWCRWALRRLRHVIFGRPQVLITALSTGQTFHRGALTARLEAARLPELSEPDQSALAHAVAHRALTGTFVVAEDGVERCAESNDRVVWPNAYRAGLVAALLINAEGRIDTNPWAVRQVGLLLSIVDNPEKLLVDLAAISRQAFLSPRLAASESARLEVQAAMLAEEARMPGPVQVQWRAIHERIVPPPF